MTESRQDWPYPGSRWWKFDFHTHTPASADTYWARSGVDLSPEEWLLKYMAAEIDCVAITDHNSGAWIDKLKAAYQGMKRQALDGSPVEGFRELTLFPGVEISVHGGFHLLVIFDPSAATRTVTDLLAQVGYDGADGNSDGVTQESARKVVHAVLEAGGIPIPAHADRQGNNGKALFAVRPGTRQTQLDANTIKQVLDTECLLAMEWEDMEKPFPKHVERQTQKLTRVLGSDCHNFQGTKVVGSRFTWVKMAKPTLEGLRLALLDGNEISVRRSDDKEDFDPFFRPRHFITRIEVENAHHMGNHTPAQINTTPYFNAFIGGRGTGKSTVVHALRLAYRRGKELQVLGNEAEPYRQFQSFTKTVKVRNGEGGLRDTTEIRVELMREGVAHILRWRPDGKNIVVEEQDTNGQWQSTESQEVNPERFPIQLFSQGQIASIAGEGRQALLQVIDDAAGLSELWRAYKEAKTTYLAERANLRELDEKLAGRLEVERKRKEVERKLKAFTQSDHAQVLEAHEQAVRQCREVDTTLEQVEKMSERITELAKEMLLDDWPNGVFDVTQDDDALAWRSEIEQIVEEIRQKLVRTADTFTEKNQGLRNDERLALWQKRVKEAVSNYESLQATLAAQGVTDPQDFGRLIQERQKFDLQLKGLNKLQQKRNILSTKNQKQKQRIFDLRKDITVARDDFVSKTLKNNTFVKIEIVGFGFDPCQIERSLRKVIGVPDDRFQHDILRENDGIPSNGLAFDIAQDENRESALDTVKQKIIKTDGDFRGQFRKYLRRKHEKPEFSDHIQCWFPEDDLRIEYSRQGDGCDWTPITQGSQGQRSAALLAFLLAFGEEPLVLDQPEDDLDNHLIYDLVVRQIRENKLRRQLIIVTHNPNVLINGDAELIHVFGFSSGQCEIVKRGALQDQDVREEVCRVMEGGREAFVRRWERLGREV